MPRNRNTVRGAHASWSRRRDDRYKPGFNSYVVRNGQTDAERLGNQSHNTEADAMRSINKAFDDDSTIVRAFIIESKTVRTYHRHDFNGDGECIVCWGVKK